MRLLTLVIVIGLLMNCNTDDNTEIEFESTAKILGFDMTLCGCCGGWIISIDGNDSNLRFSELPKESNIILENAEFPLLVKLNWSESNDYCGRGISIESIDLIE